MIAGHSFTVFASDLDRSRRFYGDQLGCALEPTPEGFVARRDRLEIKIGRAHV